jgi:Type IV pilin-like G and H, putative
MSNQELINKILEALEQRQSSRHKIRLIISGVVGLVVMGVYSLGNYESKVESNIESLCRSQWQYFYKNGHTYNNFNSYINTDGKYNYTWVKYPYFSNVALMYAQPRERGLKSFVGIAFAPFANKQKNYACQICKSKNPNAYISLPVSTSSGLSCPINYDFVKVINN